MRNALTSFSRLLAVAAAVLGATAGAVHAGPILSISGGVRETVGDPGGTNFANPLGSTAGRGLPTALGGWPPGAPGFGPDPSFGSALGITGYKPSSSTGGLTLSLSEAARVTFTFFGKGDAILANRFQVNSGAGYTTLFTSGSSGQGDSFSFDMGPGDLLFRYITGGGVTLPNGLVTDLTNSPGFFLGADPYSASGLFQLSGTRMFIGLTDLPSPGDHDFQDLGVLVTVQAIPEPSTVTVALLLVGGLSVARAVRRRIRMVTPIVS